MSGHQLCVGIALALICGPLVFALAGAYREKQRDESARRGSRPYTLGGAR